MEEKKNQFYKLVLLPHPIYFNLHLKKISFAITVYDEAIIKFKINCCLADEYINRIGNIICHPTLERLNQDENMKRFLFIGTTNRETRKKIRFI